MDICYLYLHRFAGSGSGRYMQSVVSHLKGQGHRIFIIEGMRSKLSVLRGINVKYVHFPFQVPVYISRSDVKKLVRINEIPDSQLAEMITRFAEWEVKINEKVGLDIVHASHASILPFSACIAKRICGVPYVVTVHGSGMISSMKSRKLFDLAKEGLDESEKVIADSAFLRDGLVKNFGLPPKNIDVIYPGVDTGEFAPASSRIKSATKRRFSCEGKKIVLSSGFFLEKNGFKDVIEAAAIYEKEDPDIVTLITGRGEYESEMRRMIKERGLKNTRILGWLLKKDLVKLFSAADMLVTAPTWEETFGLVSVEALSSGTPVIASKTGWLPEIVDASVGELVPPRSPQEIAKAVLDRIRDDSWLESRGESGRKRVISGFSQSVSGKATEDVYKKAAR
jgi:glycosyltransferase involved in cell wall biosynthesis